jgi:hypothetical protein
MKLSQVKQLPILKEGMPSSIDTFALVNSKMINRLAQDIADYGFPAEFELTLITKDKTRIAVNFALEKKTINDEASYHTITFEYQRDAASDKKIAAYLKTLENAKDDPEGEKYDAAQEELSVDSIYVSIDLRKEIEKVWGSTQ